MSMSLKFKDNTPISQWGITMRNEMFMLYYDEIKRIHSLNDSDVHDEIRCSGCDNAMWALSEDIMRFGNSHNKSIMIDEATKYGYKWNEYKEKWDA